MKTRTTESIINAIFVATLLIAGSVLVSACNTVAGIGEDVEAAGDAVENKAEKEKSY